VPRFYLADFKWPRPDLLCNINLDSQNRNKLKDDFAPENIFEEFLLKQISIDFPYYYFEGFETLEDLSRKVLGKPKLVITANAHWGNDLFKHWCAGQMNKGAKFMAMEHGGSFIPQFSAMMFEESISDAKITWARPYHDKHQQLPSNKLAEMSIYSSRKYLSAVGYEALRYAFRAEAAPRFGQMQKQHDILTELYENLDCDIKAEFRVKPFANSGWNSAQRFIDMLGKERVYMYGSFYDFLADARIVLCTYPQTTFSEALISGIPSILCYPKELWEIHPQMISLYEQMYDARIIFHSPFEAAAHINLIWNDPTYWWESAEVGAAKERFFREAVITDIDWLNKWASFLKKGCN
jgi:putative transferase (TIGR04331 family)